MTKSTKGIILLVLGLIIFLAYWVVLLEPIQAKYAGTGEYPPLVTCIIAAFAVAMLAATGTYVGSALRKDKVFGVTHTSFSWGQLIASKAYLAWSAVWVILTILFTIFWRNDL